MTKKQNLLVIIDLENDAVNVVTRAAWLAKLMNCDLDLLMCETAMNPILGRNLLLSHESSELLSQLEQTQQQLMSDLVDVANEHGITAETHVLDERPIADAILAYADETRPKMIIKGTQYHPASERSIFIGADWYLIRKCREPLYLVKKKSISAEPLIVAAVDPMHEDDKPAALDQAIIDQALSITEKAGGEVHLFHSYQRLVAIGTAANKSILSKALPVEAIDKRIKKEHRSALDALASTNNFDPAQVHQLPGRTHELLPTFVRSKGADLVVMGALARWGLKRMVMGSTAERVLDHLPCDVLIVRAE